MAQPVCAQPGRAARPYRALFGGDASNQRSLHQLDLTVSLNGGADNGLVAPHAVTSSDSSGGSSPAEFSGLYSAGAQLSYAMRGSRVGIGATGSTTYPYYSSLPNAQDLAYGTGANFSFVSGPTSVSAFGSFAYSPYYSPALAPGSGTALPGGSFDYASALSPNETILGGASLTRRFGRQTSMAAAYSLSGVAFVDEDRSNSNQSTRLSASRQVSRSVTFNGGYVYSEAHYPGSAMAATSRSHGGDLGLGYNRRSSRGRGSTLGVTVGGAVVDYQERQSQRWRGSLSFSQALGTNWTAGVNYRRSLQYQNELQEPVWADLVRAAVGGRFGRRVNLSLAAAYSVGEQLATSSPRFDIYSGTARVQVALAEFVAITADYISYRYSYPAGYDLPAGVPPRMDRQRLQIGASFWLPLVRAGRAREPRPAASQ
jgi:hypothetical protein